MLKTILTNVLVETNIKVKYSSKYFDRSLMKKTFVTFYGMENWFYYKYLMIN